MQSKLRIFASFLLVFSLTFGLFISLSPSGVEAEAHSKDHKIDICNRTDSHTNQYIKINVDKNSTVQGHNTHNGPIWYQGIVDKWGDIIPPFEYEECPPNGSKEYDEDNCILPGYTCEQGNKCAMPLSAGTYPGINWTTYGQAIWENNCNIPNENGEYKECSETTKSIGEWSNWKLDPEDSYREYRERTISQLDSKDNSIVCSTKVEKQYRDVEYEEYEECSVTTESMGEWSNWIVDLSDESRFVRERLVSNLDSKNSELVCSTKVEKEYKDRELCEWETATYADDPLCLPTGDEDEGDVQGVTTEVEDTTTVVLSATAAGDRSIVYLIQSLLMLVTGISLIYVGKEYLNRV